MSKERFSPDQQRGLAAVLDEIIPPSGDGTLPGAGALGLAAWVGEPRDPPPPRRAPSGAGQSRAWNSWSLASSTLPATGKTSLTFKALVFGMVTTCNEFALKPDRLATCVQSVRAPIGAPATVVT